MARIGIDIGGTFTDLVVADDESVRTLKVPSTPTDPSEGALTAIRNADVDPAAIDVFDHGTTVATNIVIERNPGTRVVLLTNDGFEDVLEIMRTDRENQYDRQWAKPDPLVPRTDRHGIPGRIRGDGSEHTPLDEEAAIDVIRSYARRDEDISYAVSMLYSFLDPSHERRLVELIEEHHPEAEVSASHAVFPQAKEYERTSTVVANAYVKPKMRRYLDRLDGDFAELGSDASLNVMQSNGGLLPVEEVTRVPAKTLFSGPAGGVAGGNHYGASISENLITMDMGGTSCDVGIVREGNPLSSTEGEIEWGIPVQFPQVDIEAVGAGGGSIAWIDEGGLLKVGPQSAGADPGPVCYGQGGTEPTVTDANLVLGRLNPDNFIGGEMSIDVDAARSAIADLGDELGMGVEETALGIVSISLNTLTQAIRTMTVERGYDPREFSLVAFGGAGPMHAPGVTQLANIPRAIVPPNAGVLSAAGMVTTDFKYDQLQSFLHPLADVSGATLEDLNATFEAMIEDGMAVLGDQDEHVDGVAVELSADLRYEEQAYEVTVSLDTDMPVTRADLDRAEADFHDQHQQLYGHSHESDAVEIVNALVDVVGRRSVPEGLDASKEETATSDAPLSDAVRETRPVVFEDGEFETTVYDRDGLAPGHELDGPFVVEEPMGTTVVLPDQTARVDPTGNIVIETEGSR
jgi:N-methylhydantoinase A